MIAKKLYAYDKKTGEYVDSITARDSQTVTFFYQDFKDCVIQERVL